MILNQIALRNFCCYRGEQVFNLAPGRRGGRPLPIVLFGGINGGGKTTLLDAVQLVLYGMRAKCSKRSDKPYDAFLRESIHLGVDPGEGAEIQLSFRYASEGREHLYEVTRTWSEVRGKIRESVQVARDGDIDAWLSENWSQVVEELIPFGIAQLCFFDAEKIRFLAEDETSTQALASAIKSLLGLDLAERLVTDAAVLESRLAKRARRSAEGEEMDRLETELAAKQAEIERLVQENGTLENPRLMAQRRLAEVEERFAKIGGQHWEQRKTRQQKLSEFEHSLKENEQRLASLAATELPLALVVDLLADAAKQAQCEHDAAETNTIATLLAERDAELLKHLKRKRVEAKTIAIADDYLARDRAARATSGEIAVRQNLAADDRRLTDQGEHARDELQQASTEADRLFVLDFVLKRGSYGPGYWLRRAMGGGQPPSADDKRIIAKELAAGHDLTKLPRPPVVGSGQLLEIREVERPASSQSFNLANWKEGASAFADAFAERLCPMFEAMSKASPVAETKTDEGPPSHSAPKGEVQPSEAPTPFSGGEMVFHSDCVTLCGADICSGPRSRTRRAVLELLGIQRPDGSFVPYSGSDLETKAKGKGAKGTAAQWIRDLREEIAEALRHHANILSNRRDVILSGGEGYRFAACVSVQFAPSAAITDITDTKGGGDVPDRDVRNVRDVRDDAAERRRAWILQQLAKGVRLKAPHVAEQFKRSRKTAQRDLDALRDQGKVEFVGDPRTGYYQLCKPPKAAK